MNTWYVRTRKGELGPFTASELRFLIRTGAVANDDLVKAEDASAWMQLHDSAIMHDEFAAPPANDSQSGSKLAVAENSNTPVHSEKLPHAAVPARQTSQTGPRSLPADPMVKPQHGIAAAAVAILLLAILAILSTVATRRSVPAQTSSSHNKPAASGSSPPPANTQQSETGAKSDTPTQIPAETIASNESGTGEPNSPAEPPQPTPQPAEPAPPADVPSRPVAPENRFETGLPSVSRSNDPDAHRLPQRETIPSLQSSDLRARSGAGRAAAVASSGADEDSERSVAMALEWLKSIQQADGSWSFQNAGPAARPGNLNSNSAATTLAVMCFLGAGNTTTSGPDAAAVSQAFAFLEKEAAESSSRDPETLYVSALATIAFSELAAMEPKNVRAKSIAASLLTFLQQSQDPIGGGWRYRPGDPGDLSVTGWQIMALQSARTCGLDVSPVTVASCSTFVDSVSFAADSEYSYTATTNPTPCMSAVGLLSRIYLGSPRQSPFFKTGFQKLTAAGPDPNNIYLNYYASIALHHYGGPLWTDWNSRMRPLLVSQQIRNGPAKGSWALRDPWGNAGGQIYQTCLSTLCLEVYYRYLPMFATDGNDATENREKP
ncbi:MAG: GYF domain-containing protein [Planctomyces sp.]